MNLISASFALWLIATERIFLTLWTDAHFGDPFRFFAFEFFEVWNIVFAEESHYFFISCAKVLSHAQDYIISSEGLALHKYHQFYNIQNKYLENNSVILRKKDEVIKCMLRELIKGLIYSLGLIKNLKMKNTIVSRIFLHSCIFCFFNYLI